MMRIWPMIVIVFCLVFVTRDSIACSHNFDGKVHGAGFSYLDTSDPQHPLAVRIEKIAGNVAEDASPLKIFFTKAGSSPYLINDKKMESEKIHGGTFKQWFQMIETSTARFSAMTQSTRSDKPAHVKQEKWDSENWDVTIVTYPATQQTHFQVTPGEDGKTVKIASAKLFDYMQTFHHFESDHDEYMNKALHLGLQNGYDVVVIQATRKQNATTKNAMLSVAFGSEIDVTEDYPLHKSYVQQMLQTKTLDYMISNSTGSYGFVIPELSIHQSMMYLDPEPIIKKEKHLLERSWQGMLASFFGIQFDPIVISTQIQGAQVINNYAWEDKHPFEQTIQTLFNYGFDYDFGKAFFRSEPQHVTLEAFADIDRSAAGIDFQSFFDDATNPNTKISIYQLYVEKNPDAWGTAPRTDLENMTLLLHQVE